MITRVLFQEYQNRPSPDALVSLLRACADPVYNFCFQVLRHRQDAEDAAQIVLLKLIAELPSARDIDRFDRWMYRVAINTALKDAPEDVNAEPYGKGWMIELEPTEKTEVDELMNADAYTKHVATQ